MVHVKIKSFQKFHIIFVIVLTKQHILTILQINDKLLVRNCGIVENQLVVFSFRALRRLVAPAPCPLPNASQSGNERTKNLRCIWIDIIAYTKYMKYVWFDLPGLSARNLMTANPRLGIDTVSFHGGMNGSSNVVWCWIKVFLFNNSRIKPRCIGRPSGSWPIARTWKACPCTWNGWFNERITAEEKNISQSAQFEWYPRILPSDSSTRISSTTAPNSTLSRCMHGHCDRPSQCVGKLDSSQNLLSSISFGWVSNDIDGCVKLILFIAPIKLTSFPISIPNNHDI